MNSGPVVMKYNLRDPATLLGNATYNSLLIPCRYAREVIFRFVATNAQALAAITAQVSNNFVAGNPANVNAASTGYTQKSVATALALNVGGYALHVVPDTTRVFCHDYIRAQATVTGGATPANDVTGFAVTAEVIYEDAAICLAANQVYATV